MTPSGFAAGAAVAGVTCSISYKPCSITRIIQPPCGRSPQNTTCRGRSTMSLHPLISSIARRSSTRTGSPPQSSATWPSADSRRLSAASAASGMRPSLLPATCSSASSEVLPSQTEPGSSRRRSKRASWSRTTPAECETSSPARPKGISCFRTWFTVAWWISRAARTPRPPGEARTSTCPSRSATCTMPAMPGSDR